MPTTPYSHGHLALPFGRFYGKENVRRTAPGLEMSVLRADPHRVVERHSHDDAHFVLVLDGLYVSTATGAPPVSAQPLLIFNPAGTTHRDRFEARGRVIDGRFLTISVATSMLPADAAERDRPRAATVLSSAGALATALRLARECERDGTDAPLTRQSLVLDLLAHVAAVRGAHHRDAPAWLSVARERLDDSMDSSACIADIAALAGVHPVHFARVFRQHLGLSPAAYLRRRRIAQARDLLRFTSRPLSDIALTCGFSDQSHFTNAFRRATGATPSECRAQR